MKEVRMPCQLFQDLFNAYYDNINTPNPLLIGVEKERERERE